MGPDRITWLSAAITVLLAMPPSPAVAAPDEEARQVSAVPDAVPDIRDDETKLKLQKGDFVVVPIPMSNPTLGTGLVLGAAYFYSQTEAEKKAQPASVTAAAALYTSNKSGAYGVVQQNYWDENKWRFTGVAGHVNLRLDLLTPEDSDQSSTVSWLLNGNFLQAKLSRRIAGEWYAGIKARFIEMSQEFGVDPDDSDFGTEPDGTVTGVGIVAEFDSRDAPFYSRSGKIFNIDVLFNHETFDIGSDYQSFSTSYRSYHQLGSPFVLAWEIQGCARSGEAPLWDSCRIDLRGFPATDYLGNGSASGQAELRWQFHRKWGAVAFAGAGYIRNSFSQHRDREAIPSYGLGLRFSVLDSQGINMRLDYARSVDSDAVYLSVGEAF